MYKLLIWLWTCSSQPIDYRFELWNHLFLFRSSKTLSAALTSVNHRRAVVVLGMAFTKANESFWLVKFVDERHLHAARNATSGARLQAEGKRCQQNGRRQSTNQWRFLHACCLLSSPIRRPFLTCLRVSRPVVPFEKSPKEDALRSIAFIKMQFHMFFVCAGCLLPFSRGEEVFFKDSFFLILFIYYYCYYFYFYYYFFLQILPCEKYESRM